MKSAEFTTYRPENLAAVLSHPSFSHTRWFAFCGVESLIVYFRCEDSPTGVLSIYKVQHWTRNDPAVIEALRAHRECPNHGPSRGEIACGNVKVC